MAKRFFDRLIFSKKALKEMPDAVSYDSFTEDDKLIVVVHCEKSRWVSYGLRRDKLVAPEYFIIATVIALCNVFHWAKMSSIERVGGLVLASFLFLVAALKVRWWIWRHPAEERIIVDEKTVTIEHEALGTVWRKRWPTAGRNIRLQVDHLGGSLEGPAYLCMDTGLRVHTFAHNLSESDARQLLSEIRTFLRTNEKSEQPKRAQND